MPTNLDPATIKPINKSVFLFATFLLAPIGPLLYLSFIHHIYWTRNGVVYEAAPRYRWTLWLCLLVLMLLAILRVIGSPGSSN